MAGSIESPASPALVVISAMITPALLILGSGSLVGSALMRLGRVVDRARALLQTSPEHARERGWTEALLGEWLATLSRRAIIAEQAVTAFFAAVGIFVVDCLSIAVDHYAGGRISWVPITLTIAGMLAMLYGAYLMLEESRYANRLVREEIQRRAPIAD